LNTLILLRLQLDWKNLNWRTAVREAGALIEGPSETPQTSQLCGIVGFEGGPQLSPHDAERR